MARVWTAALSGVAGIPVEVEVRLSSQLPRVDVVGLPEAAVRESISRIRGAIAAGGARFPDRRVTVNLAPAELRKDGAGLDLPIAIGILAAQGLIDDQALAQRGFIGELALDGRLRVTRGSLAGVLALREDGMREAIVPAASASHAAQAPDIDVVGAASLSEVLAHLTGRQPLPPVEPSAASASSHAESSDCLRDVRGQPFAKRALEVAAAGGHGLLLTGPPGTGKSLLARRLPGLLPPLGELERLELFCIHDAAGIAETHRPIPDRPPFRAPHHGASAAGLLGGGHPIRPGEVSLAHHGVLFLDELPEFDRRCLESLREILEQGVVRIARARSRCVLPARFQLVAAANPCPCGQLGAPGRDCRCDDATLQRYRRRLSGPLLDRIDLIVTVQDVPWQQLRQADDGPTSETVRRRVELARIRARARGSTTNAELADATLDEAVCAEESALALLGRAVDRLALSARGARRTLRIARTVADLGDRAQVTADDVAEALQLRGVR
jgi:magnesium chelatase family protein